jgi:hypothetical protein
MKAPLSCIFTFVLLAVFPLAEVSAADFEVLTQENIMDGKRVDEKYTANDFYSTYYIYLNVIRALEIEKRLSEDEIGGVIGKMIANLRKNGMTQLTMPGYSGEGNLRVSLRVYHNMKNGRPILLLVSNYDPAQKRIVTGDASNRAYATYFYLVRDKLVKYQYIANADEKKRDAQKSVNDLADYYLLDESSDDDAEGKALLINGIKKEKDDGERFIMYLTLSEYYLLENNTRDAKKALDEAGRILNASSGNKRMQNVYGYAMDIYKYYVASTR